MTVPIRADVCDGRESMDDRDVVILDEGVDEERVAEAAACCQTGPQSLRTGPDA
jgi:hypothetical protein